MYSLAPEKTLRLVYEPFYLAIQVTFYEFINYKLPDKAFGRRYRSPPFDDVRGVRITQGGSL